MCISSPHKRLCRKHAAVPSFQMRRASWKWVGEPVSWARVSPKQPPLAKLPQTSSTLHGSGLGMVMSKHFGFLIRSLLCPISQKESFCFKKKVIDFRFGFFFTWGKLEIPYYCREQDLGLPWMTRSPQSRTQCWGLGKSAHSVHLVQPPQKEEVPHRRPCVREQSRLTVSPVWWVVRAGTNSHIPIPVQDPQSTLCLRCFPITLHDSIVTLQRRFVLKRMYCLWLFIYLVYACVYHGLHVGSGDNFLESFLSLHQVGSKSGCQASWQVLLA